MLDTTDSYTRAVVVTPSDSNPIVFSPAGPTFARRLWVDAAGTVTVITLGGDTVAYMLTAPGYIRMNVTFVKATGTSGGLGIVAEY